MKERRSPGTLKMANDLAISDFTGPIKVTADGRTLIKVPGEVHSW